MKILFFYVFIFSSLAIQTRSSEGQYLYDLTQGNILSTQINWYTDGTIDKSYLKACRNQLILSNLASSEGNNTLSREYKELQMHNYLSLKFDLWRFGKIESSDTIFLRIEDGNAVTEYKFTGMDNHLNQFKACGEDYPSSLGNTTIYLLLNHTSTNLTLAFKSSINTTEKNWGISDLEIRLFNSTMNLFERRFAQGNSTPSSYSSFNNTVMQISQASCNEECDILCYPPIPSVCSSCPNGQYFQSRTCMECHQACQSCTGSTSCLTRKCNSGSYDIFYWDNTCEETCDFPLKLSLIGDTKVCVYPCSDDEFLYWDGSCKSECESPLISNLNHGKNFCGFPCQPDEYLYWDGQCRTNCSNPLKSNSYLGRKTCDWLCEDSETLFWDGTCALSYPSSLNKSYIGGKAIMHWDCPDGLALNFNGTCVQNCGANMTTLSIKNKILCLQSCSNGFYMYWNGTCLNKCPNPLKTKVINNIMYCLRPCGDGFFYYWNGTCGDSCRFPLKSRRIQDERYCDFPCENEEILFNDGNCGNSCNLPLKKITIGSNYFCNNPCNSSQFVYPDFSCGSSCLLPLQTNIYPNYKTCSNPCNSEQFLLIDGTCVNSCPSGFNQSFQNGTWLCSPKCKMEEFYNQDHTCSQNCSSILTPVFEDGIKKCKVVCGKNEYLNMSDMTCVDNCPYPFQVFQEKFGHSCANPCPDLNTFYYNNGSCRNSCHSPFEKFPILNLKICRKKCYAPLISVNDSCVCPESLTDPTFTDACLFDKIENILIKTASTAVPFGLAQIFISILLKANPIAAMSFVVLMQKIFYLNLLNFDFMPWLKKFLDTFKSSTMTFWSLSESFIRKNSESNNFKIKAKFIENNISGSFIIDAAFELIMFSIVLLVRMVFGRLAQKHIFEKGKWSKFIKKGHNLFEYTILIRLIVTFYYKLSILSSIQITNLKFDDMGNSGTSFAGILMEIFAICLPYIIFKMILKAEKSSISQYAKKVKVIFEDYNKNSAIAKNLTIWLLISQFMAVISLTFFFEFLLVQNLVSWLLSLIGTILYAFFRPHTILHNNTINIINNLCLLLVHSLIFILSSNSWLESSVEIPKILLSKLIASIVIGTIIVNIVVISWLNIKRAKTLITKKIAKIKARKFKLKFKSQNKALK